MIRTYADEKKVAIVALREAMSFCQEIQSHLPVATLQKEDRSPVTTADFGSQALICQALATAFPQDPICAEEAGSSLETLQGNAVFGDVVERMQRVRPQASRMDILSWIERGNSRVSSRRFWTLDPLDGTRGFLRREHYALALALIEDGQPVLAVLACPSLRSVAGHSVDASVLVAVRGEGSRVVTPDDSVSSLPLRVSQEVMASRARLCGPGEASHAWQEKTDAVAASLGTSRSSLRLDSQVKYALVAAGDAEVYLRLPLVGAMPASIWDHAAGVLLVEEAGGRVTDLTGKPIDFTRGPRLDRNQGVVATNSFLHEAVLRAVREVGFG